MLRRGLLLLGAVSSLIAALILLLHSGLPQRADYTSIASEQLIPTAPELNALAPDFEALNIAGERVRLSEQRGRQVLVNFWATWCGPCIVEMPILQSLYEERDDLTILAVNLGENAAVIADWQREQRLTYPLLRDENQAIAALYRLRGQPSTYVISPNGIITAIFFGPVSKDALSAALEG